MKGVKAICIALALMVRLPIYFYLMYKVLVLVHATDVMWLLFYVYLPLSTFIIVVGVVAEWVEKTP